MNSDSSPTPVHKPSKTDRNFDGLAERFRKTIYDTPKGQLRLLALQADLDHARIRLDGQRVLDLGGGQGQFSRQLAEQGALIDLCDISTDMIARAEGHFNEAHLSLRAVCCPIQASSQHFPQPYPLVMNHAVLEWLEHPFDVLPGIIQHVEPGGWLSLMFYNLHGHQWRQLMNGRTHAPTEANQRLREEGNSPQHPLDPHQVFDALTDHGMRITRWRGIRCIHDHMHQKIRERIGQDAVNQADLEFGLQEPYRQFGRYIHVLAQKPSA